MTLSTLLTTIQGLFSRRFWFGAFLPVAIAAIMHLMIGQHLFHWPGIGTLMEAANATRLSIVLACLVIGAYALMPLLPWIRGLLDGSLLPQSLHDGLRAGHAARAREARAAIEAAYVSHHLFIGRRSDLASALVKARAAGAARPSPAPDADDLLTQARTSLGELERSLRLGTPVPDAQVEVASALLEAALAAANADDPHQTALDGCHRAILRLLDDLEAEAKIRADALADRSGSEIVLQQPQATAMADARNYTLRYSLDTYNVPFEFLWPRIQLVFGTDKAIPDELAAARGQCDFAILTLVLIASVVVLWLPLLAWFDPSPWLLIAVGTIGPFAIWFCLGLAYQSELAQGELIRSVIDRYRFDVLKTVLRLPMPATLEEERQQWDMVMRTQAPRLRQNLTYKHPI